jgi:diaminopimelate epimerase
MSAPSRLFKVEGAGNDFVAGVGDFADRLVEDERFSRYLCDRRLGIGADGTLSVTALGDDLVRLVYHNADGSLGVFCANGTRCAARVAREILGCGGRLQLVTGWTTIAAEVRGSEVALDLPPPGSPPRDPQITDPAGGHGINLHSIGVPHLVIGVAGLASLDLDVLGPPLRAHDNLGPEGANVNFFEVGDDGKIRLRTWERGVEAETRSCGSGMVAVALQVMADRGIRKVEMAPKSGDRLTVEALGEPPVCPVRFTGPTRIVAEVIPTKDFLEQV